MKVSRVQVERYRNLRGLDFKAPIDSGLLCLTGRNGCGKSNLLRLISMAVGQLGLGGGMHVWGEADGDAMVTVTLDFSDEPQNLWHMEPPSHWPQGWTIESLLSKWNKSISVTLSSELQERSSVVSHRIEAPGLSVDVCRRHLLPWLEDMFDSREELKHVHIQSDRGFDDIDIRTDRMSSTEILEYGSFLGRKNSSFKSSRGLYAEWKALTITEELSRLAKARADAREAELGELLGYEDPLSSLNGMVQAVLPHIVIQGVDAELSNLIIRSNGIGLDFRDLSGGEREVVFLCGQILRLRVTKGILLIDEPELHLNPELLRRFLTVIQQTAGEGQLWLATHSYEAIEAAGASSTFVMEPEAGGTTLRSLRDQPVVETLATVLGRAGFGLSNTTFIIVEGSKGSIRERQRFSELVGHPKDLVFADIGEGKRDVKRMLDGLLSISKASGEQLRVKAVIDSDFDSLESACNSDSNLYQLGTYEVENLFLHPASLTSAVSNITPKDQPWNFEALIKERFAATAGRWIWHRIQYRRNDEWKRQQGKLDAAGQCAQLLLQQSWNDIQSRKTDLIQELTAIDATIANDVRTELGAFPGVLDSPELWKHCFGKEMLKGLASVVRFADHELLERAVISAWDDGRAQRPQELNDLRTFLGVAI